MQVQLLNSRERTKQYAVIFYQGDEAFSGLLEFADKYKIMSAHCHRYRSLELSSVGVVRSSA